MKLSYSARDTCAPPALSSRSPCACVDVEDERAKIDSKGRVKRASENALETHNAIR